MMLGSDARSAACPNQNSFFSASCRRHFDPSSIRLPNPKAVLEAASCHVSCPKAVRKLDLPRGLRHRSPELLQALPKNSDVRKLPSCKD